MAVVGRSNGCPDRILLEERFYQPQKEFSTGARHSPITLFVGANLDRPRGIAGETGLRHPVAL
jgi:hypothetical protein